MKIDLQSRNKDGGAVEILMKMKLEVGSEYEEKC